MKLAKFSCLHICETRGLAYILYMIGGIKITKGIFHIYCTDYEKMILLYNLVKLKSKLLKQAGTHIVLMKS